MTTPSRETTNPLERLREVTAVEAARRESARAANRARFPQLAEAVDVLGATLEWAKDDAGEIGRIKPSPANGFWISAESYMALQQHAAYVARGRK